MSAIVHHGIWRTTCARSTIATIFAENVSYLNFACLPRIASGIIWSRSNARGLTAAIWELQLVGILLVVNQKKTVATRSSSKDDCNAFCSECVQIEDCLLSTADGGCVWTDFACEWDSSILWFWAILSLVLFVGGYIVAWAINDPNRICFVRMGWQDPL